ncbi:Conserved_hypothetical protein [Hexamita inflata]|uniref:Transmembrane protein n=1 Tax=Hexamita inflata TaxID=28002 RepID=A0AA86P7E6_9EUKA|nr:Conserved hypothetical protein [Hexamita inflata]
MVKCCSIQTKQKILIFTGIILSPLIILCLILAALCYCGVVLPAKVMAYMVLMKKYQLNRKKKYISQNIEQLDKFQYELQDIMFSFKPLSQIYMYISLSNGFISLLNQDLKVMKSKQLQYKFTSGQVEEFLYYISLKRFKFRTSNTIYYLPQSCTLNIVMHQGIQYILIFDFLFILNGLELKLVAQIPDFAYYKNLDTNLNQSSQLFTLNNKLYVHNCATELFEVNNNKLKCVNRKHKNYFYAQFCDKLFALTFNKIFQVNNNFELNLLQEMESSKLLFCSGAVLIMVTVNYQHDYDLFYILNMLDSQVETRELNETYQFIAQNKQMNYDLLELGENGFKFKDEVLDTIFGPEFKTRVQEYEKGYYSKMPKCKTKQISKFVFDSKMELILEPQFKQVNAKLEQISQVLRDQMSLTNDRIDSLLSKTYQLPNLMVQSNKNMINDLFVKIIYLSSYLSSNDC